MEVKVRCSKFECREEIHFKTQPGPVAKNATPSPKPPRLGIEESACSIPSRGRLGVALFATGPG